MKKQLLLLAVSGLLITGCSQVEKEDVDQQTIAFHPMVGKATRGAETTTANLKSIKVYALGGMTYDDTYDKGGSGAWTSVNKHFWPATATVKFHAYAPSTLTSTGTLVINNYVQQITEFSPKTKVAQQEDFVVAYSEGTKAANETSGVPLNFKHALSQIVVKAKNENADIKVEVKAVKLGNIYSKANFMFPTTVTGSGYVLPRTNWINQNTPVDYTTSIASSALALSGTAQDIMSGDGGMMLIPQQVTQWLPTNPSVGAYIAVLCRIVDVAGGATNQLYPDPSVSGNLGQFAYAAVGISPNWEPGKKYVYTLDFSNGYGNIPPNQGPGGTPNPGNDPGKPILDSPIKVTVTVDTWGADQNIDVDVI